MAINAGSVYAELILKGDQYFNTLDKAQKNIDGFADKLKSAGKKMQSVGKSMMLKVTTPLVAIGTAGTKMALDLETGIRKVTTLADKGILPTAKIQAEVRAISDASGIAQTEISEAVYAALSAGVESEKVLEFVRSGIDLTRAGFTSMETAIDATTTVLNAYGEDAYEVSKIHDIFVQTQDKGKISVDELGSSIGRVIPTASSLGVNLDQLGAGYAILTAKGQNAQLATTNFNAMLGELGKTGSDTDEALRELTGKSFKELMEGGKSVGDVLGILNKHAEENGLSLKDMFGSMNAGSAAVTLISDGVDGFNAKLDDMNNATGKTKENAKTMEDGWYKINKAVTQVKNALIDFGTMIAPTVEKAAGKVSDLVAKFSEMDDGTKKIILVLGTLVAATGPVLWGAGQLITSISTITALFAPTAAGATAAAGATTGLAGAMTALTGPVGIAIAGVAAITAGGTALYNHLSKDSIPAVELFGDEVSESTQRAVGGFLELEKKATLALNQLNWSGKEVTEEMTTEIVGAFEAMKDNIITELEEQKSGALESFGSMFASMAGMAEEEKAEALRIIGEKYEKQIEKTEEYNKKIAEIMERAKEEKRALNDTEKREINEIKEAMKEDAIRILSDSEAEQLAIMERLKLESGKISALQAADVVKNSKEQKDKTIAEAEKEYNERLKYAAQLKVDGSEESQKLADKVVGAAEYQYKEAVKNAEAMHEDIVAEAKLQAKEHIEQVDWETGEIKTKWQMLKEKVLELHREKNERAQKKEEEHKKKMKDIWEKITVEIPEKAKELKDKIVQKWEERNEELKKKEDEHRKDMEKAWNKLKEDAGTWASNMMDTFVQGIENKRDAVKNAVAKVTNRIKDYLGFASPTKEGPLSDSDKWMPSFMQMLSDGIKSNKERVTKETDNLAKRIGDSLGKVNDYVQTTASIIEKKFQLWAMQNDIVKESSEYLSQQLEMQRQKHEILNEQIKATQEALEKVTEKYGENSIQALELQNKLLDLKITHSTLGQEIKDTTDAINNQTSALKQQIEIIKDRNSLSVRTEGGYFSRSSSDWYTWTDDEGKFRSGSKKDYDDYTGRSNITDSEVNRISREHGVDLGVARDMAAANERAKKKGNLPIYHWGGWVGKPLFDMEGILEKLQGMLGHDERLGLLLDGEYVLSKDILNKFRDISTGTPTPSGRTERSRGDIKQTVNIYSPTPLSPSETARKQLQASRQLAMEWGV